jgi:Protein of unknown function (DUF3303)
MKYVMSWTPRVGGSGAEAEEATKRSLAVFSKWSPPSGVTFHQFVSRLDTGGGYAVVETDDPKLVAEGPAKFGPWFDFEVVPVVDITEAVPIAHEAIAFRDSVS